MRFCVSSTLKRNPLSKRLKASKGDVKIVFHNVKNHEESHTLTFRNGNTVALLMPNILSISLANVKYILHKKRKGFVQSTQTGWGVKPSGNFL